MKNVLLGIVGVLLFCGFIYGGYWIAKTVSYSIFYEDMVKETDIELVKTESLK